VIAAEACGLVTRIGIREKVVDLQGTEFLNEFFVALSEMHEQTWNEFLTRRNESP
jgi:hypothetical protein